SFTPHDTERVAAVLRFAALQIPFYIIGSLASRVVVAMQATRFIIILSAVGLVGNASLNWLLMRNLGAAGIALSTVLVQMLSAAMACLYVLRQIKGKMANDSRD
ncbi:MAG: lipid II flippase MurJ, partial [Prosthecobacter sp.]